MSGPRQRPIAAINMDGPLPRNDGAVEPSGSAGFISWGRLQAQFREVCEIKPNETVRYFVVLEDGIKFFVETKS